MEEGTPLEQFLEQTKIYGKRQVKLYLERRPDKI